MFISATLLATIGQLYPGVEPTTVEEVNTRAQAVAQVQLVDERLSAALETQRLRINQNLALRQRYSVLGGKSTLPPAPTPPAKVNLDPPPMFAPLYVGTVAAANARAVAYQSWARKQCLKLCIRIRECEAACVALHKENRRLQRQIRALANAQALAQRHRPRGGVAIDEPAKLR